MAKQRDKSTSRKTARTARTAAPAAHPGSERERDEQRKDAGPQHSGGSWQEADRRGDARSGHAGNADAESSDLAAGQTANDDSDARNAADPDLAIAEDNGEVESGGQRAGMGRGEKPRKAKSEEK